MGRYFSTMETKPSAYCVAAEVKVENSGEEEA